MKSIEVGDRVRVDFPGGYLDRLEGVAKQSIEDSGPGFKWWSVHFDSLQESYPLPQDKLINLTPDTSALQPGFYWVLFGGGWTIGELDESGHWWMFYGDEPQMPDEIGERIERKEAK